MTTQTPTFTWTNTGKDLVPVGAYQAEFIGMEKSMHEQYGEGYSWRWKIIAGEHKGKVISRQTGIKPTPKNACGKLLVALLGKTPSEGENIDPMQCVGRKYLAIVGQGERGTRLETVTQVGDTQAHF